MTDAEFADLYRTYSDKIFRYAYRRCSCPDLAADVMQETFAKALTALRAGIRVRHTSGWLYRIAHNLVIDYYRARDMCKVISLEDAVSLVQGRSEYGDYAGFAVEIDERLLRDRCDFTDRVSMEMELGAILAQADECMTDKQCAVLQLRELDGYTFEEVASVLGVTEGAIKALRSRGIAALQRLAV